jgi:hypothetical protein
MSRKAVTRSLNTAAVYVDGPQLTTRAAATTQLSYQVPSIQTTLVVVPLIVHDVNFVSGVMYKCCVRCPNRFGVSATGPLLRRAQSYGCLEHVADCEERWLRSDEISVGKHKLARTQQLAGMDGDRRGQGASAWRL